MSGRRPFSLRRKVELARAGWALEASRRSGLRAVSPRCAINQSCHRTRCRASSTSQWTCYERMVELNHTLGFQPLTSHDSSRLEEEARARTSDDALDRQICAITDVWVFPSSATRLGIDDLPYRAMQATLTGGSWCTQAIASYYDCSSVDPRLDGLLLSRNAFQLGEDGRTYVWISTAPLLELRALEARLSRGGGTENVSCKPPRFAIADGFVAGGFPEIDELNFIERQTIALAQVRGVVKVVYGGPGNVLNSHLLCWDNRDATIASRVPSVVSGDRFQLILAGPMTPAQELLLAKRHECSGQRIKQAHDLLRSINPLYANVGADEALLASSTDSTVVTTRVEDDADTQHLIDSARARQATVTRGEDGSQNDNVRECTVVESQTVLMETIADRSEQARLSRAVENVIPASTTYVAQRSTAILQAGDPSYIERLFPHLLTFGVGGFSTVRHHRYSLRAIVLHYLNLSSNRFAEDPMFKLLMFDYLSTMRVKRGVFLRVGQDPSLATTSMRVTPTQLKDAMRIRVEQRTAWKSGRPLAPTTGQTSANTLLKSINAATSKMWGSNEEREAMMRKADSMMIQHGAPSVFWTLTPNPGSSLVCAFWTGRGLPNGRPASLSKCGEINMPCSSEMSRLVMANTTVQAQYYKVCCEVLIDVLFGWDTKANKPKSRRGIFGYVEALLYALEQQGRLFIHHHGVAWVAGLPKTESDWNRLLTSDELRRRFERYCASIFAAELPVYNSIQELRCPRTTCNGHLNPSVIPRKFKHLLRGCVPAPIVALCDVCDNGFSEPEITHAVIERAWSALGTANRVVSTASAVDGIRHKFCGLSSDAATAEVQLSRLLLKDQVHTWTHLRSCVKGRSGTKCRYKFFRKLAPATCLNTRSKLVYRRSLGNQWLNPFIGLWRRVLHFNMDARVLWSGDSLQAARYALQYALKRQTVLDNVAVVDLAFKRRVSREIAQQSSVYAQGVGRLLSLAYASSGVMEMGGPLATAILHEGEAVSFSCVFERLVLLEGLNLLQNIAVEATVVTRNHQIFTETSISRYVDRPRCLEHLCWYEYCSWICRNGSSSSRAGERCTFSSHDSHLLKEHVRDHGYRHLDYPRVPEIIGPRLPDASRLGDEDYTDQTELYYRMTALLYCPFRDVVGFLDDGASARAHFEKWAPHSIVKVARRLEYHQQHYVGLKKAQEYRASQHTSSSDEDSDDDAVCYDDDVLIGAGARDIADNRRSVLYETVSGEYYAPDPVDMDGMEVDDEPGRPVRADAASPVVLLLSRSIASMPLPPDNSFDYTASTEIISRAHVRNFEACDRGFSSQDIGASEGRFSAGTTAITVQTFIQAIQDLEYNRERHPTLHLAPYASIKDVSTHFRLNRLQHVAFTLIAVPLLSKISGHPVPAGVSSLFDDTALAVTGAGGTGKSQIISAVRALAAAWGQPRAVSVVASTGIAAASLSGLTMHSSVGLGVNARIVPKHISTPTDLLLQQWAPVHCVIADEVSMIDLRFFGLWEESLRYAKEDQTKDYGGLLTVLMFDHCQLRCVKGMPMYRTSNGAIPPTPAQDRGKLLYRQITKVVYLTENMRFAEDPEWGEWLTSGRLGKWTPNCRAYIRSLLDRTPDEPLEPVVNLKTISTDNATRATTNDTAIRVAVRCLGSERRVYVIPAQLSRRPTPSEAALLRLLPDNKTGHIPLFLQLYIGMPVRVKTNQCVMKGVANGATGTVFHIDWDAATTFASQSDGTWLASCQPRNIYVNIANSASTIRFPMIPSDWPSSVMPIHQATASVKLNGSSLSIRGYPFVPAFGTTVHGVQGETLDAVAITSLRPPHVRRVDPHALYVALSRLRTRRGLHWIGSLPTEEDFEFFRPDPDVVLEDGRLKHLADATLALHDRFASLIS